MNLMDDHVPTPMSHEEKVDAFTPNVLTFPG